MKINKPISKLTIFILTLVVANLLATTNPIYADLYQENHKKARFIITGEINCVQKVLNILATKKL